MLNLDDKVRELMERAGECGLRLELDCGLVIVRQAATDDPVRQRDIIAELGKYFIHIRRLVERRAIGARAKDYVDQKVWLPEHGEGKLVDGFDDGSLTVTIKSPYSPSQQRLTARADNLLIVLKDAPIPADKEATS